MQGRGGDKEPLSAPGAPEVAGFGVGVDEAVVCERQRDREAMPGRGMPRPLLLCQLDSRVDRVHLSCMAHMSRSSHSAVHDMEFASCQSVLQAAVQRTTLWCHSNQCMLEQCLESMLTTTTRVDKDMEVHVIALI